MADLAVEPKRRRGQLSRARILAATLQLVDQDGLESLTMRRLADHLQVDPMSIYNYVDGKEALLDGLTEALWNEVQLPEGETSWKETLRAFAVSLRQLARNHPHAYGFLLGRGIMPESALRAVDTALASLGVCVGNDPTPETMQSAGHRHDSPPSHSTMR